MMTRTSKLADRRSIRQYTEQTISESLLDELMTTATRASNTGNMQLYSVIVTRDQQQKEALAPHHFNQPMVTAAPVVLTFCADVNRFVRWAEKNNAEAAFDNFQMFMAATIDTIAFAEHFCVAAEEQGLGICYLGTTTYNARPIIQTLALPRLVVPITTITVGYPVNPLPEQSDRLPLHAVVHYEQYADYSPQKIDQLYADKEALEESRRFVEENGKETLAQVYTEVRYTKANNLFFSTVFLEVLKEQGFPTLIIHDK